MVLFGVTGEEEGQRAVTGDVAGGAEAVLKSEDGEHQAGAGVVEAEHAGDQTERRAKGGRAEELVAQGGPSAVYPPAWQSARYQVVLSLEDGQWKIKSLNLREYLTD